MSDDITIQKMKLDMRIYDASCVSDVFTPELRFRARLQNTPNELDLPANIREAWDLLDCEAKWCVLAMHDHLSFNCKQDLISANHNTQ